MKTKALLTLIFVAAAATALAQVTIKGKVTDKSGNPLIGASVTIKGAIDGASTDTLGAFHFKTKRKGAQAIIATYIGYESFSKPIAIENQTIDLHIILKETPTAIKDVVITAGSFEAGDKKKGVTLKPLDIYTTASASGDMYGALNTLPGTAAMPDDGRLFVRGGDAYESLTFIDGLRIKNPYSSSMPDLPSRGRYAPQLFTGTTFSSGGYSAQYGQALSSALILQTTGIASKNQWGFGLLSVGVNGSETLANESSSISAQVEYYNLKPYYSVVEQKYHWNKYPETFGTTIVGRQKVGRTGLLKVMSTLQMSHSNLQFPDFNDQAKLKDIDLKSKNFAVNMSYTDSWGKGWSIKAGAALSVDDNRTAPFGNKVYEFNTYLQSKVVVKKEFSSTFNINGGFEVSPNSFMQKYWEQETLKSRTNFSDNNLSPFIEVEAMLFNKLAVRGGLRGEYSSLLNEKKVAPRLSLAWLVGDYSQLSVATGIFYQTPEDQLLRFTHNLNFEKANHYIINYQITKNDRIFRVEAYRKDYSNLVRFNKEQFYNPTLYNNDGNGYAQGFELFWRDQKTVKNLDYWVSYSYIDSKRLYRDFTAKATPTFAPKHNVSVVGKWFVPDISTQFGATAMLASGRPYNNPTSSTFMDGITKSYFNISLNVSYIFQFFGKTSVLYLQTNNLLGRNNVYGYNFYKDAAGAYQQVPVTSSEKRGFLFGVFLNW